jgi:hypothetical protein
MHANFCKLPRWPDVKRMGRIAAFLEEVAACRQNSFAANCRPALLWASSFGQVTVLCVFCKLPQWPDVKRMGRIAAFLEEVATCRQKLIRCKL